MDGDTCASCSRSETRRSAKRSSASGICGTCPEMSGDADIVLVDGKVFTGARDRPWAKALAIRGDRLLAVGTSAQAERWRGGRPPDRLPYRFAEFEGPRARRGSRGRARL